MQKFTVGCKVKIEDIGSLATCMEVGKSKIKLEIEGEMFWIPKRFCEVA